MNRDILKKIDLTRDDNNYFKDTAQYLIRQKFIRQTKNQLTEFFASFDGQKSCLLSNTNLYPSNPQKNCQMRKIFN